MKTNGRIESIEACAVTCKTAVMAAALLALLAAGLATPLSANAQAAAPSAGTSAPPSAGSSGTAVAPSGGAAAPRGQSIPSGPPARNLPPTTSTTMPSAGSNSGRSGIVRPRGEQPPSDNSKAATAPQGPVLTLQEYLGQVKDGSQLYKAATLRAEGADLRSGEFKLLTRPNLIANADYDKNKAEQASPIFGDEITTKKYTLGIEQQTTFGLNASLLYNVVENESNSTFISPNKYSTASPQLVLTQSLWRNWLGGEIVATQVRDSAAALATKYDQSFQQTQILAEAETAYWRLALAREGVQASRETLALTERSQKWSANRQRLALADRSDLLQSNAAMLARQLELQISVDEERAASRAFNTVRGIGADIVVENLSSFESKMMDRLQIPERKESRADVKAAEQRRKVAEANTKLAVARNSPTVNVRATMGLNGLDPSTGEAITESQTTNHPNYGVGLQMRIPLDFGTASDTRAGYRKEELAEKAAYERKLFEEDRLWHELTSTFQESLARYKIAAQMEAAQREKVTYERTRHGNGRTTLYNVIVFETDFANAQYARIRAQTNVLNAYAQLKTFGSGQ